MVDLLLSLGKQLSEEPLRFTNEQQLSLQQILVLLKNRCLLEQMSKEEEEEERRDSIPAAAYLELMQELGYAVPQSSAYRNQSHYEDRMMRCLEGGGSCFWGAEARVAGLWQHWRYEGGAQAALAAALGFARWYCSQERRQRGLQPFYGEAGRSVVSPPCLQALLHGGEMSGLSGALFLSLDLLVEAAGYRAARSSPLCVSGDHAADGAAADRLLAQLSGKGRLSMGRSQPSSQEEVRSVERLRSGEAGLPAFLWLTLWRLHSFEAGQGILSLSGRQALQLAECMYSELHERGSLYQPDSRGRPMVGPGWRQFSALLQKQRWSSQRLRAGSMAEALQLKPESLSRLSSHVQQQQQKEEEVDSIK